MLDRIGRKRKRGYKVECKLYLGCIGGDEHQLAMTTVESKVRLQVRGAEVVVAFASELWVSFTHKALKTGQETRS